MTQRPPPPTAGGGSVGLGGSIAVHPPILSGAHPPPLPPEADGLGGDLLQRRQQTLLGQVGLQRVEDVELLVDAERQELLDHLRGVGAPERGRHGGDQHTSVPKLSETHPG